MITPWVSSTLPSVFSICIWSDLAKTQGANDAQHYLYVRGEKGPLTKQANLTASVDGISYHVFTNDALEAMGVGYIARWRVSNQFGTSGQWRTLQAGGLLDSPDPATAGIPFWRNRGRYELSSSSGANPEFFSPFSSFSDWLDFTDGKSTSSNYLYVAVYGVELESRYVMLVDADSVWNAELDPYNSGDIEVNLVTIRPHPTSYGVTQVDFRQTFKINLQPYGTCTTPSLQDATRNFNWVFASAIPDPGDVTAEQVFDFTLTNCPRVNLTYYVHANGNKWVNSGEGIVGMEGSTPHADPVIGNPRGIGIQLLHNGSQGGFGKVYIHPGETTAPVVSYVRAYPGTDATNTSTGVTHTIPLRARVIRTHPSNTPIQPGQFKTSVVFVFSYQ